ncbi:hypothetical protein NIES4071_08910 [Calothrix sp. NIES-4071]|nr:hypothetical protein NIES4071_08910 [Calothrix sp. NIES-4071]BAZ55233.1 hypothetical protein NIES4105_08870 [Calothrix sp. NIES-4105]
MQVKTKTQEVNAHVHSILHDVGLLLHVPGVMAVTYEAYLPMV